jgi:RNA polymerase sigma-B factor
LSERVTRGQEDEAEILRLFERFPDERARDELVRRFLPLAEHLARRFAGRGEALDDLVQVASLGLLRSIDRFDPARGVQFATYASVTIVGELKRHFRDKGWSLRVPRSLQESAMVVNRTLATLWQELGRSPTVSEVARRADLSEDQVLEAMDAVQAYSTSSLDAPVGQEGTPMGELIGSQDDAFERSDGWASVAPAISRLPARERRILYLRFFEGRTQTEIAEDVGISQMHVSRLLAQTLARIRRESDPGNEEAAR